VTAGLLRLFRQEEPPNTAPDAALRVQALLLASLGITILATLWVATYAALGLWASAAIPALYQGVTVAGLLRLRAGGTFEAFRRLQLWTMLVFPFLLQWTLGGAAPSGAVMLWALVAPLGALVFGEARAVLVWLAGFLALTAVSGVLEGVLSPADVPATLSRVFFMLNAAAIGVVVFGVLRYFLEGRRRALDALADERARSERLLRAILPEEIAERLKRGDEAIADGHPEAGVLFADIVGFTELAARTPPREIVALLDEIFASFDRLAEMRGVEKIKTLGDGYLAVAGVPHPREGHVDAVALLALDLREELARIAGRRGADLSVRIGIDAGPLVAGVIGRRRFGYDVWGDTVNTATPSTRRAACRRSRRPARST
jgi:adenylate cyclase